jgi:PAS domain S-box-containing protein
MMAAMGASFSWDSAAKGGGGAVVRLPVALALGAGIVISVVAAQVTQTIEQRRAQATFELAADQTIGVIEDRINEHIQLTYSIAAYFHSSPAVERNGFTTFVGAALKRYDAIQGLGWVPRVSDINRAGLETAARREGFGDFQITERTDDGRSIPAARRDEYYPTYYLEPPPASQATLGLDHMSHPARREALERARDSGEIALSGRVELTLETDNRTGLVAFVPIYWRGVVPDSIELRRRDLAGFAFAQIRPARIVDTLRKLRGTDAIRQGPAMRIDVFDTTDAANAEHLFTYATGSAEAAEGGRPDARALPGDFVQTAEFGGRQWTMVTRGAAALPSGLVWQAWAALAGSLALAFLFAAYLHATLTRARSIEVEVQLRTNELMLTNQLLHQSEDRIRAITDSVPAQIAYLDRDFVYRFANRRYLDIGIDPEAMIGKTMREVRGEASFEKVRPYMEQAAAGEPVGFEMTNVGRDGQSHYYAVECAADRKDGVVNGFYILSRDISALKAVERMKDEFFSTVSHELRTPLTSIKGALGLMRAKMAGSLPADMGAMLEIAYKNCDRLVLLINDILDIEKIEAGKMDFRMQPVDIVALVKSAVEANQSYADQFGVVFELESAMPAAMINADEGRIMQVMANLLSNAAKFSPENGRVQVRVARHGRSVRVSVQDHGAGIPEEFRSRIFGKFSQHDSSDRRKVSGTGLGLSIVRAIVERHGGDIAFDSTLGRGSTFYFDVPELAARAEAAHETASRRILICEDDDSLVQVVTRQVGSDTACVSAGSVGAAKQVLGHQQFDLAILDLLLPDGRGEDLLPLMRNPDGTPIPVIIFSALEVSDEVARRVDKVLVKTKSSEQTLIAAIDAFIARRDTAALPATAAQ